MSHDTAARRVFGVSVRTLADRISRVLARATAADLEAGARWYDEAGDLATDLGRSSGQGREVAAAVIAHLSPRTTWTRNVAGAISLLTYGEKASGVIGDNFERARAAVESPDPIGTLNGPKTRRFALNILGDREAVTVDVWAARAAGVDPELLGRVGAYGAVEHAYRIAARRAGLDPATAQATAWIVVRGGRKA